MRRGWPVVGDVFNRMNYVSNNNISVRYARLSSQYVSSLGAQFVLPAIHCLFDRSSFAFSIANLLMYVS